MHPDWTGSPQHFVAGLALALAVVVLARRAGIAPLAAVLLAFAVTMAAEALVELAEYPLLYAGEVHPTAYYDTVADIADTFAGALVALTVWAACTVRSRRFDR